jgi:putative hydrolase of the HAD superfamily
MRFEKVIMTGKHDSLRDTFINVCEEFNVPPRDFIIEKLVGLWNKNKLLSRVYEDTIPALTDLKSDYKIVLVANIDKFSKDVIDRFKLSEYFDMILLSCDTGLLKSDGKFFDMIIEKFDVNVEDLLMVGDSIESDMLPAKTANVKAILIDRQNKREYDSKIVSLAELIERE